MGLGVRRLSTAGSTDVAVAKSFNDSPYGAEDDDFGECCKELHAAVQRRDETLKALKAEYKVDELEARYDELLDAATPCFRAIETYPVRSIADLIKKTAFIVDDTGELDNGILLADLHRIAGGQV